MPLTGELENLPIVDVIQLIHSTRKSGILTVYSRRGEGQLIFNNGYIVSAIHSNEDLKIGKILVEKGIISESELNQALATQQDQDFTPAPLISILHEQCEISRDDAYNALETLIELTLVEMISWTRGIFTLETEDIVMPDDYKYLPKDFQNINLDTQMVLMDALRIFDEKVYAGEIEISDEPFEGEVPGLNSPGSPISVTSISDMELSEEILGLADLDQLERKKPLSFEVLDTFDPFDIHRESIVQALPSIAEEEQKKLVSFLSEFKHLDPKLAPLNMSSQAVVLYSSDQFLQHAVMTVCRREGLLTFTPASFKDLEGNLSRALSKGYDPILVIGLPDDRNADFSHEKIGSLRSHIKQLYPTIPQMQLSLPEMYDFSLSAYDSGCRAVIPYPLLNTSETVLADDLVRFLRALTFYIRNLFNDASHSQSALLKSYLTRLVKTTRAPDISLLVLKFVSEFFSRALTLVIDRDSLIMERSIGLLPGAERKVAAPLRKRMAIPDNHIFARMTDADSCYYDEISPSSFPDSFYADITAPLDQHILLLPLKSCGRVVTLTYADFGSHNPISVPLDLLHIFMRQAGLAIENALLRKNIS